VTRSPNSPDRSATCSAARASARSTVGELQALAEHEVAPDLVVGTSVGSLNGAALARDPTSGPNGLLHVWA
jgi:predicted acylesterase/phospholipase RssA